MMRVEQLPYYRAYKPAANSPAYEERVIFFDMEMDEGRFLLKDGGDIICNDDAALYPSAPTARPPFPR